MNESHPPVPDCLEEVVEAFQQMTVPDRPSDADVLAQLGTHEVDSAQPISVAARPRRAYFVRLLVPSAAAAVLLVGALALWVLNNTAPLAVADVLKAAVKHKLVRYKQQQTTDTKAHVGARLDSTVYADLTAPRLYTESQVKEPDGEALLVTVQDLIRHLTTNSRQKTARLCRTPKDYKSFCCSLEEFEQKQGVTQVRDNLGGLATVKYHFVEGNQASSLWVDAKTKLPVRMEQELANPTPDITCQRFVWTGFEWDPELPKDFGNLDKLFSTQPPQGYTLDDQIKDKNKSDR